MLLSRIPLCVVNLHQPSRSRVSWDDFHYTYASDCRHCGRKIIQMNSRSWIDADVLTESQSA